MNVTLFTAPICKILGVFIAIVEKKFALKLNKSNFVDHKISVAREMLVKKIITIGES
jgi:hypothetical protein